MSEQYKQYLDRKAEAWFYMIGSLRGRHEKIVEALDFFHIAYLKEQDFLNREESKPKIKLYTFLEGTTEQQKVDSYCSSLKFQLQHCRGDYESALTTFINSVTENGQL